MSVGFIGAGQLAHALVKGFTAAGEASFFAVHYICLELNPKSLMSDHTTIITFYLPAKLHN